MDQLYSELTSYKNNYKINTTSNPIPLSLKLLDTSSIGLNRSLNDILHQNDAINSQFKKHILENEDNVIELNDNLNDYIRIFVKYINAKNVDYVDSKVDNFNTNSIKTLNDKITKNSYILKLLSLIEVIVKKQNEMDVRINDLRVHTDSLKWNSLKSIINLGA